MNGEGVAVTEVQNISGIVHCKCGCIPCSSTSKHFLHLIISD